MPKVYSPKQIRQLQKEGRITDAENKNLKSVLFQKKSKTPLTFEARQAAALEQLPVEISKLVKANVLSTEVLTEMIRKIRPDVKLAIPEPAKGWEHTPVRGKDGKIMRIISKVVR